MMIYVDNTLRSGVWKVTQRSLNRALMVFSTVPQYQTVDIKKEHRSMVSVIRVAGGALRALEAREKVVRLYER